MVFSLPTGLSADILFGLVYPFLFISGAWYPDLEKAAGSVIFLADTWVQIILLCLTCKAYGLYARLMAYMATAGINAYAGQIHGYTLQEDRKDYMDIRMDGRIRMGI